MRPTTIRETHQDEGHTSHHRRDAEGSCGVMDIYTPLPGVIGFEATENAPRLDKFLTSRIPQLARNRLQALIRSGHVTISGVSVLDPSHKINLGDKVVLHVPSPTPCRPQAERIPLDVLYEDDDLIVINKPAGMVVHPAPGNLAGTLVNALLAHCPDSLSGIGGQYRPGIVHRLDKDTSGLLVIAKNDISHRGLSEQFASHGKDGRLQRTYDAIIWHALDHRHGTIDIPTGRSRQTPMKQSIRRQGGKRAVTHFRTRTIFVDEDKNPVASWITCELETGRTHQIRVHMAHSGHPLLGDPLYGRGFETKSSRLCNAARDALAQLGRQALHASHLSFLHPRSGKRVQAQSPLPHDLSTLLETLQAHHSPTPS